MSKHDLLNCFVRLGGAKILLQHNRTPRVFCFHGIDYLKNPDIEQESMPVDLFVKHIDYINSNFNIISIDEFSKRIQSNALTNRDVVLTFDDGYKSTIRIIDPILRSRGLPYTVFLATNNITTGDVFTTSINRLICHSDRFKHISVPCLEIDADFKERMQRFKIAQSISKSLKSRDYDFTLKIRKELIENIGQNLLIKLIEDYASVKLMTWDDVKTLHLRGGVTFGAHTCNHICCHSSNDLSFVKKELIDCKHTIEEKLQCDCNFFAYPNGIYTEETKQIANDIFSLSFTTDKTKKITSDTDYSIVPRIAATYGKEYFQYISSRYPNK